MLLMDQWDCTIVCCEKIFKKLVYPIVNTLQPLQQTVAHLLKAKTDQELIFIL